MQGQQVGGVCTAERLAGDMITCRRALTGFMRGIRKLTWGEGSQKGSFHRLPVWGEWPNTVNVQQTQRCLMGVHLLHWQPTLHWGKENTRLLPDHHSLGKVQRAEWGGNKGRATKRREVQIERERWTNGPKEWRDYSFPPLEFPLWGTGFKGFV